MMQACGTTDGPGAIPPDASIIVTGFMGSGKSTVGRLLAGKLQRPFIDMDTEIERREGRAISDIFAREGEPVFRRIERALVEELADRRGLVVATGGGVVLDPDNIADFSRTGLLVCLDARPEVVLARVEKESHRPLLEGEARMQRITNLMRDRAPCYARIAHHIDTNGLSADAVAEAVLSVYEAVRRESPLPK